MSMIVWNDDYCIGIQEIDEQHKRLVNNINELYAALADIDNREKIKTIIHKLVEYTKIHFAIEETLMRIFSYDDYEEHKLSHDNIIQKVLLYQSRYLAGDNRVGMELLMFLKDWLFEHINREDKRYSNAFLSAGVKKRWLKKFW